MKPKERKYLADIRRIPNYEGRLDFLRLDKNEHLDMVEAGFLDEFKKSLIPETISVYPEIEQVRKHVAKYAGIEEKHIFLSHGSDAAIKQVFDVFAREGSFVLLLKPTYAMYQIYASMVGAKIKWVECDDEFKVSQRELSRNLCSNVSIAAIANPNSPTGSEFSLDFLLQCLKTCQKLGILLLIDEAYFPFCKTTLLPYVAREDNLVVTRTFSKAFALGGCRAGFMAVSDNLITSIGKARPMYEINALAALAIKVSLKNQSTVAGYLRRVRHGRDYLVREVRKLGLVPYPVNANFINIRLSESMEASNLEEFGRSNGILFKGSLGSGCFRNCIRVTLGPKKHMRRLVELLQTYIKKHG